MPNPECTTFVITNARRMSPSLLLTSLHLLAEEELITIIESDSFALWPERHKQTLHDEIFRRMAKAALINAQEYGVCYV